MRWSPARNERTNRASTRRTLPVSAPAESVTPHVRIWLPDLRASAQLGSRASRVTMAISFPLPLPLHILYTVWTDPEVWGHPEEVGYIPSIASCLSPPHSVLIL